MEGLVAALAASLAAMIGWVARRLEKRLDEQDIHLRRISRRLRDMRRKVGLWREADDHEDDGFTPSPNGG